MKRVLITGKGSYIGTNVKKYLEQYVDEYVVDELDMMDESWKEYDFSKYDVVYHVAGIAHIKEVPENEGLYTKVNRDLVIEVAKKAKEAGIKQFIFMSSMSVYGLNYSKTAITADTVCNPNTFYGVSKYQAEVQLQELVDTTFKVCVLRPPMVYGDNSPGNLTKLFKAVRKFHVFPTIKNQRSSITVEKLAEYVKGYIDAEAEGLFLPQNDEYMCTYNIVKEKMEKENVKVIYLPIANPFVKLLIGKVGLVTKCFGNLVYEKNK